MVALGALNPSDDVRAVTAQYPFVAELVDALGSNPCAENAWEFESPRRDYIYALVAKLVKAGACKAPMRRFEPFRVLYITLVGSRPLMYSTVFFSGLS